MSSFTKYLVWNGKEDEDLKPGLPVCWNVHNRQGVKLRTKYGTISSVENGKDFVTVSEVVLKTYKSGSTTRHTGTKYDVNISELFICNSPGSQVSDDEETPPANAMQTRSQTNAGSLDYDASSRDELLGQLTPVRDQKVVIHDFQVGMRVKGMDPLGEGTVKWMGHFKGELVLGLEMDEGADWYTGNSFGVEKWFPCRHRSGHIVRAGTCIPLKEAVSAAKVSSLEDGSVGLTEMDLKRHKIQLRIGMKAKVLGHPGKGIIRWIGYLSGDTHLSVGYEMDKPRSSYGDGTYKGWKVFDGPAYRCLFVKLFQEVTHITDRNLGNKLTGSTQTTNPCLSTAPRAPPSPAQVGPIQLTAQQHKLDFNEGDTVEVDGAEGTVCWIGYHINPTEIYVGLDMAGPGKNQYGYGHWKGFPLFDTGGRRTSHFVNANSCRKKGAKREDFPFPRNAADLGLEFDIGSRVELVNGEKGRVRWIGTFKNENLVGLIMDVPNKQHYNQGELDNYQMIEGPPDRCHFVPCSQVKITFVEGEAEQPVTMSSAELGLEYEIDSRVELQDGKRGRVRWIGRYGNKLLVGLEMRDRDMQHYHHGMLGQHEVFHGHPHQCYFVSCDQVKTVFDDPIPTAIGADELGLDYDIDDIVRVTKNDELGKVRWIGKFKGQNLVGLEMNGEKLAYGTDGRLGDYEVFKCEGRRSWFVKCNECHSVVTSRSKHRKNNESAIPEGQVTQSPHMPQRLVVQSPLQRTLQEIHPREAETGSSRSQQPEVNTNPQTQAISQSPDHKREQSIQSVETASPGDHQSGVKPASLHSTSTQDQPPDCRNVLLLGSQEVRGRKEDAATGSETSRVKQSVLESVDPKEYGTKFRIGSKVKITAQMIRYGEIKWIGKNHDKLIAGLEMEPPDGNDGDFLGKKLFECRPGTGLIASLDSCRPDDRKITKPTQPKSESSEGTGSELVSQTAEDLELDYEIGSEIKLKNGQSCTVRWLGCFVGKIKPIIGVELDEDIPRGTDGTWRDGKRYFECPAKRGMFIYPNACLSPPCVQQRKSLPLVGGLLGTHHHLDPGVTRGSWKGIEGSDITYNLESVLYPLFAYHQGFDESLLRLSSAEDDELHGEMQCLLRENIVNPLRQSCYVSADHVEKLLNVIDTVRSFNGLFYIETDPVKHITYLLENILGLKPLLTFSNGHKCSCYPLELKRFRQHDVVTVHQLLEESLFEKSLLMTKRPDCLLLHMVAEGQGENTYPQVRPSLNLDLTSVIQSGVRVCRVCGGPAIVECRSCFQDFPDSCLQDIFFCASCNLTWHGRADRQGHNPTALKVAPQGLDGQHAPPRQYMELFAVITRDQARDQYVSYVKCANTSDWLCMDGKKEKIDGKQGTFYIPVVHVCEGLPEWLPEENHQSQASACGPNSPQDACSLMEDAYIYFYRPV